MKAYCHNTKQNWKCCRPSHDTQTLEVLYFHMSYSSYFSSMLKCTRTCTYSHKKSTAFPMPISKKLYQYWFYIFRRHFVKWKIWVIRKYENQTWDNVCRTENSQNLLRDTDQHKMTSDTSPVHLLYTSACSKYLLLPNHYPNTRVSLPFKWTKCYVRLLLYTKTTQQNSDAQTMKCP
jgi:hypothetical protein